MKLSFDTYGSQKTLLIFVFILNFSLSIFNSVSAQPGQNQGSSQLAEQYYNNGEYDKAKVYYEKNYDFDPFGTYDRYLKCLIALKDFDGAAKLVKKQMKKANGAVYFLVDLGNVYELQGENDKAKDQYVKAIKSLKPDVQQYIMLANRFIDKGDFDNAILTYTEGRKNLRGQYSFGSELAEAYSQKGDQAKMIAEYLNMLDEAPAFMANLQTLLQNKINLDYNGTMDEQIRIELLKRIQASPQKTQYSELLYWLLLQEKDFDSAVIQAKSLDKRLDESGVRLVTLGQMAASNQQYVIAEECFQYVLDKGHDNSFYLTARMSLINARNQRITTQSNYTNSDLKKLDHDYETALSELGRNSSTAGLIQEQAHLKAFYLNDVDTAIAMMEDVITIPGISAEFKANCKLDLGDILVFKNEVWDALLYYGQVDKDFKHDELGREAKFRTARAYYYEGQFEWAAAQLNILKAATTQLISNDAMQLALLIQDNTTIDTNTAPLLIYANADLLEFQNHHQESLNTLDSLLKLFPNHSLTDEVWFKKAEIYQRLELYDSTVIYYTNVFEKYPDDILADDALYSLAFLYDTVLKDKLKAKDLYEKLLQKYPGSLYAVDSRKRFRALRGDKVN